MSAAAAVETISRFRHLLGQLVGALLIGLVLVTVVITAVQVTLRYGFRSPLRWSEEAARYIFVWICFVGAYEAYRRRWHLGLDIFSALLPKPVRFWLQRLSELVVLATLVWAIGTSGRLVQVSINQTSAVLGLPMITVYAGFLVGSALICIDIVLSWLQRLLGGADAGT